MGEWMYSSSHSYPL